nr:PREDICTED: uncharacterized protein LOC109037996 isoform X2 [Bemisia tabaci]
MTSSFSLSDSKLKAALLLGAFLITMGSLFIGMCEGAAIDSLNSIESGQNGTEPTNDDESSVGVFSMANNTCTCNETSPLGMTDLGVEDADPQEIALAIAMMMADAEAAISELGTDDQEDLAVTWEELPSNQTSSSNDTDSWF